MFRRSYSIPRCQNDGGKFSAVDLFLLKSVVKTTVNVAFILALFAVDQIFGVLGFVGMFINQVCHMTSYTSHMTIVITTAAQF